MPIPLLFDRRSLLIVFSLFLLPAPLLAQGKSSAAVKCTAVHGALLGRSTPGAWESLPAGAEIEGDRPVVALFGAAFQSLNGAVEARLVADVGQRGPFPVLEAAAAFHRNAPGDLSVTLDRGIMVLTNTKKNGPAKVQLRVGGETFDVELHDSKSKVGIEIYGRHAPGPPILTSPKEDAPVLNAAFFALEGESVVTTEKHATRLHAPPGTALFLWDNLTRMPHVERFETLPDSVKPMSPEERKKFETLAGFAQGWSKAPGGIVKGIEAGLASKEPMERKAAVVALGALDQLPRLVQVLSDTHQADARDMAILALRHWLGRAPGHCIAMHAHLTTKEGYTPTQAKNLIYLLKGIEEDRRQQPETFDLLIGALNHAKLPARELARWHLVRLAPAGRDIPYDAAAAEPMRLQAIAAWRRLIPEGELPPPPK